MPCQPWCQLREPLVALSEDLKGVLWRLSHNVEDFAHIRLWNALVEKIAHRVDENQTRTLPAERLPETIWPEP